MNAILAEGLSKSYDGIAFALKDLHLCLEEGSVFGFLGPNGAGKTTTVKLMAGLIKPSEGSCNILGFDPFRTPEELHAICGVMTETAHLYGTLTGKQNLQFFGEVCGMTRQEADLRADELLKQLDLWGACDKRVAEYSTGMLQRLSLARAMVNHPRVLFLDEPTSGLDPESAQSVNVLIKELAMHDGATVFLCTHQLRYAQDVCTAYGILENGRLLASGDLQMLSGLAGCQLQASVRLRKGDILDGFDKKGRWQVCTVSNEEEMPELLHRILETGHDIYEAKIVRPTLEDVYFGLVKEKQEAKK